MMPAAVIGGVVGMLFFMLLFFTVAVAISDFPSGSIAVMAQERLKSTHWLTYMQVVLGIPTFAYFGPKIGRIMTDLRLRRITAPRLRAEIRSQRRLRSFSRWVVWIMLSGLAIGLILVPWQLAALMLAKVLADVGGVALGLAFFGRRGRMVVCARCDYPLSTWRGSPQRCPECGSGWKAPWGARVGVCVVQWWLVATGLGMLALSAGLLVVALIGIKNV